MLLLLDEWMDGWMEVVLGDYVVDAVRDGGADWLCTGHQKVGLDVNLAKKRIKVCRIR